MQGIVVLNKPTGMTSHDVVSKVRRKFNMRRVGHAGTLDPLATGVLVMLLGESTKLFGEFEAFDKAYKATVILGTKTTTADIQGKILEQRPWDSITREQVETVFESFLGEIDQVPPMVSAVKFKGKRLYELARKGIEVHREPRKVLIKTLRLLEFQPPQIKLYLECSKGTYVRQLAEDVGRQLNSVACVAEIERTKVGPFDIREAVTIEALDTAHVKHWRDYSARLPK